MKDGFVGTRRLFRLILRLDRLKLSLWLVGLCVLIGITPVSLRSIIDNEAEAQGVTAEVVLAQQAALLETNGASIALQGPPDALDTFGGRAAFEIGAFTFAIVALMNVLLISRHTRAEEESGRAELVRAAAIGPWSALAAVTIVAVLANLIIGVVTAVVFAADGLDPTSSALFGLGMGLSGLVYAAIGLVSVQIFEHGRAATGAAIAVIGATFAIRAVGDVNDNWLSLLSPIGWAQAINPFGDSVLWPVAILLLFCAAAFALAIALVLQRDVGAGLIEQRPGPPQAPSSLLSPLGLAWRLQRSTLIWWCVGLAFMGGVYGSVISAIDDFVEQNETMRDMLEAMGMSGDELRNGFITVILSIVTILAAGGVVQSMLRPRGEETSGRAEPVLGTSVSRWSWLGSHLLLTATAAPVFMIVAGLGLGVADALVVGQFTDMGSLLGASLARVPALWAIAGIGVLLYGMSNRITMGVWLVFATSAVIFLFGDLLRLPDVALNLSPIGHVTHLPGGDQGWTAVVVLSAIGLAASGAGLALFSRRDIDTT